MKNANYYSLLVLLLFLASCKETPKETDTTVEVVEVKTSEEDCMNSGYQIFKETALIWENSWRLIYPNYMGTNGPSPRLSFSKANLEELRGFAPTSDGVRMYYCLVNATDTIPSLAMVPMKSCNNIAIEGNQKHILFSELDGEESFISQSVFNNYANNWRNAGKDQVVNSPVAVYAYNYSWQELLGITEDADAAVNSGLWVQYGLRTLGPGDTEYFKGVETINDTVTGNVVYCNIVYKESPERSGESSFDFAKPCPTFCGNGQ